MSLLSPANFILPFRYFVFDGMAENIISYKEKIL